MIHGHRYKGQEPLCDKRAQTLKFTAGDAIFNRLLSRGIDAVNHRSYLGIVSVVLELVRECPPTLWWPLVLAIKQSQETRNVFMQK